MANKPIMILIGGINGAGKTTFYYEQLAPELSDSVNEFPYVNADELEHKKYPNEVGQHSLEMGKLAANIRQQYLETGQSFITETVFSHESKNKLILDAQKYGFFVHLNHIHVSSAELAYKRVKDRVMAGGHDVSRDKVEARYTRTINYIRKASETADVTIVWDNSKQRLHDGITFDFVLEMNNGEVISISKQIPDWAKDVYKDQQDWFK